MRAVIQMQILLALLVAALTACAVPAKKQDLNAYVTVPDAWRAANASNDLSKGWLASFSDRQLEALVAEAQSGNFDLQLTTSRVRSFQAQRQATQARRWPQLSASLDASRDHQEISGLESEADSYGLAANLAWEVDVWQRLGNQVRAAVLDVQTAQADLEAARLSLAANVARGWYDAVTASRRAAFAKATEDSFADTLHVIETRYRSGIGDALDVTLARANLQSARSQSHAQKVLEDNAVLQLETLLGRYPARELSVAETIPDVPAVPATGIPAQLVERRPDLRSARLAMLAETERLKAANKNYLPGLNLTASYGSRTDSFGKVLDLDDLVWRVAGQLVAPIFNAGSLEAERELAAATQEQSVLEYASLALNAFQEVESALRAEAFLDRQHSALQKAVEESQRAESLAHERYASGLVDITTLLDAQRRAVDSQRSLIDLRNQRLQNRINLYLALGGDFRASISRESRNQ